MKAKATPPSGPASATREAASQALSPRTGAERDPSHDTAAAGNLDSQRAARSSLSLSSAITASQGSELPEDVRRPYEVAFGQGLSGVRVHSDGPAAEASHALGARAFTTGSNIYFRDGQFAPHTSEGRALLAHELAHAAQAGTPSAAVGPPRRTSDRSDSAEVAARDAADRFARDEAPAPGALRPGLSSDVAYREDDVPESMTATPDPDKPVVDKPPSDDDDAVPEPPKNRDFPFVPAAVDPALLLVPDDASRADVAARLFISDRLVTYFDLEQVGGQRGARARYPGLLRPEALSAIQTALEAALTEDTKTIVAILCQRRIDANDELRMLQLVAKWSKRSNIKDASGTQYFSRFLGELESHTLTRTVLFHDTRKNALQWLYVELEENAGALGALVSANSGRAVPEGMEPAAPGLSPEVDEYGLPTQFTVGYYREQWPKMRMALTTPDPKLSSIYTTTKMVVDDDPKKAETALRNSATRGPRVLVPGKDKKYYGYSVYFPYFEEGYHPPAAEDEKPTLQDYWFVQPGTVFIKGGEYQPELRPAEIESERQQYGDIFKQAADKATSEDPTPALGLDFNVLASASLDQRIDLLKKVVATPNAAETKVPDLIARIVYATPAREFPLLERRMATEGITDKLLKMNVGTNVLALIGRVFTVKALASMPLGTGLGGPLETFTVGKDEQGFFHYATAGSETVDSKTTGKSADDPTKAPGVGSEPPIEGQAEGPFKRTAIVFYSAKVKLSFENQPSVKSRPFLPFELVQVNVIGPKPRTMIVTATEAAGILDIGKVDLYDIAVKPMIQVYSIAFAASGVLRVFGPALAEGLLAGGLRGAVAGLGEVAATRVGTAALFDAAVLGSLAVVEGYRSELQATEAGRNFLAAYDTAMTILVARDLYQVATSGILGKLYAAGTEAWAGASAAARAAIARSTDTAEAIVLAVKRTEFVPAQAGLEAGTGARVLVPKDPTTFTANLRVARGEVAGRRLVSSLKTGGQSTAAAESVMEKLGKVASREAPANATKAELEVLEAQQKAAAHAQLKIAERAAAMPAEQAEAFLQKVQDTLAKRPNSAAQLTDFLTAATKANDPAAYLAQVDKLLAREKVTGETLRVLGAKARGGTLDLEWLNNTSITDKMLDSIGRDPRTPWNALKIAATDPTNVRYLQWARSSLRGIGAEVATEDALATILPGQKMTGYQVKMEGSVIDYSVSAVDQAGKVHGVEVKGWTTDTWREALKAYKARSAGATLTEEQAKAVKKIDHMLGQLANAKSATGTPPYLVVTDGLTGPVSRDLNSMLAKEAPGTTVKKINEAAIKSIASNLGQSLGIPAP
jgi:hypothetical protein